jgi:hypothetical protein
MTTETAAEATAENLRADFLNATTAHARWRVLNRALQWALDASESADFLRCQRAAEQTVALKVDVTDSRDAVAEMERQLADLEVRAAVLEVRQPELSTRVWKDGYMHGMRDCARRVKRFPALTPQETAGRDAIAKSLQEWHDDVRAGKETPW